MNAVRERFPVFADTDILKVSLLTPDAGETVSHVASQLAVQSIFDVTVILFEPPVAATFSVYAESVSEGGNMGAGDCVTSILDVIPLPCTDMIAERAMCSVFASVDIFRVPLFSPDDGETVIHFTLLLAVQLIFDVTVMLFDPPVDVTYSILVESVRNGVATVCVAVISFGGIDKTVCADSIVGNSINKTYGRAITLRRLMCLYKANIFLFIYVFVLK
jgi:hypothetical protein